MSSLRPDAGDRGRARARALNPRSVIEDWYDTVGMPGVSAQLTPFQEHWHLMVSHFRCKGMPGLNAGTAVNDAVTDGSSESLEAMDDGDGGLGGSTRDSGSPWLDYPLGAFGHYGREWGEALTDGTEVKTEVYDSESSPGGGLIDGGGSGGPGGGGPAGSGGRAGCDELCDRIDSLGSLLHNFEVFFRACENPASELDAALCDEMLDVANEIYSTAKRDYSDAVDDACGTSGQVCNACCHELLIV